MRIDKKEIDKQYCYMHKIRSLIGESKKVYMLTFGCQQNEADSERLAGMAQEMGYTVTPEKDNADLIIINTCAIREHAEKKALSITGQCKHLKTKNPELIIAICGCMVTQKHRAESIKHSYPYVDILFDTSMVYRFPEILYTKITKQKRQFMLDSESKGNIPEGLPQYRENPFKAWLSIMYGCNNFCTYCIVPYVRGRERSRLKEDILREAKELVAKGYKEITLLGQNVNSYGKDLEEEYDFSDLLKDICAIEGDFIIRFMTSHPKDATCKLIDTMASEAKIAKHFHLPLQAGNNRVLDKMNRRYTREKYLSLIDYMRQKMPDIGLTTDIIVGFPTETEEEFEETLDILRRVGFDNIYSFIYSPRKGTPAAEMDGQVPDEIKGARFQRLLDTQNEISITRNKTYEQKPTKVLVEGWSKTDKTMLTGRNEKNRLVHFKGDESLIGKFVTVMITEAETYSLFGELI